MIRLNLKAGNNIIQIEGETQIDVFKQAASVQETFGESCCGKCQSTNLQYVVRISEADGEEYEYPELHCKNCNAKLTFGQEKKNGGLWPIRFQRDGKKYKVDENGKKVPKGTNGWVKYNFQTKQEE